MFLLLLYGQPYNTTFIYLWTAFVCTFTSKSDFKTNISCCEQWVGTYICGLLNGVCLTIPLREITVNETFQLCGMLSQWGILRSTEPQCFRRKLKQTCTQLFSGNCDASSGLCRLVSYLHNTDQCNKFLTVCGCLVKHTSEMHTFSFLQRTRFWDTCLENECKWRFENKCNKSIYVCSMGNVSWLESPKRAMKETSCCCYRAIVSWFWFFALARHWLRRMSFLSSKGVWDFFATTCEVAPRRRLLKKHSAQF